MEISSSIKEHLTGILGAETAAPVFEALEQEPSVSIRLNPSKLATPPAGATPVPWSPYGYILKERPSFTMDPLFHAGCYYVQDSSAMFVGHIFRQALDRIAADGTVRVLDLCAAPGGKTTDLAASLRERFGDRFILVSNEVMKQRAAVLCDNVSIWGDPNVVVTSVDPAAFSHLGAYFDIIVADVPCSGEGMFRKDSKAVEDWSEDLVELCAQRQRRIVADVWPSLKEGGILVYSTCTFEPAENDLNLRWVADELGGEITAHMQECPEGIIETQAGYLLVPGRVSGEGQWAGSLVKTAQASSRRPGKAQNRKKPLPLVISIPEVVEAEMPVLSELKPLHAGVLQGEMKGTTLVPAGDMALSIGPEKDACNSVEVDLSTALHFLHRDAIVLKDAPLGYVRIDFEGHPLGFVKNLGNRCNNLHPQSRRILKQIEI